MRIGKTTAWEFCSSSRLRQSGQGSSTKFKRPVWMFVLQIEVMNIVKALSDGFKIHKFEDAVDGADLVLMLIPEHAQPEIYNLIEAS